MNLSNLTESVIKHWYNNLPFEEKLKVRDLFIEMLEANYFEITRVQGLQVDAFITVQHPRVKKYLKKEGISVEKVLSEGLGYLSVMKRHKIKQYMDKLDEKLQPRFQAKALHKYYRMVK